MQIVNLIQGTPEWNEFRSNNYPASEAPAMMGDGKFEPKTPENLALVRLGIKEFKVSDFQQKIFDEGHAMEACARPLVEELILGESLSPMTGRIESPYLSLGLSASLDGITFDGDVIFEHKKWTEQLGEDVRNKNLSPFYYWQLEQQLLVSGAKKVVFVTSDSFKILPEDLEVQKDNLACYSSVQYDEHGNPFHYAANYFGYMEYEAVPGRADKLVEGWQNFEQIVAEVLVDDDGWQETAENFLSLPAEIKALDKKKKVLEEQIKPYKTSLIDSAKTSGTEKMVGAGVQVLRTTRKGGLDEKKLLELITEEQIEACRKPDSITWQVRETEMGKDEDKIKAAKDSQKTMGGKVVQMHPTVPPSQNVVNAGNFNF
jgi:hypothetical protein